MATQQTSGEMGSWIANHLTQLFIAAGVIGAVLLWMWSAGAFPLQDGSYSCRHARTGEPNHYGAVVEGGKVSSIEAPVAFEAADPVLRWTDPKQNGTNSFRTTVTRQSGGSISLECTVRS